MGKPLMFIMIETYVKPLNIQFNVEKQFYFELVKVYTIETFLCKNFYVYCHLAYVKKVCKCCCSQRVRESCENGLLRAIYLVLLCFPLQQCNGYCLNRPRSNHISGHNYLWTECYNIVLRKLAQLLPTDDILIKTVFILYLYSVLMGEKYWLILQVRI